MKTFILTTSDTMYGKNVNPFFSTHEPMMFKSFDAAIEHVEKTIIDRDRRYELRQVIDIIKEKERLRRIYIFESDNGIRTEYFDIHWDIIF